MDLLPTEKITGGKIACSLSVIFLLVFLTTNFVFNTSFSISSRLHLFLTKTKTFLPQSNHTTEPKVFLLDSILVNLTFSPDNIYHHDGIAYDYYSKNDLGQSTAGNQWKIWSLPHELNQSFSRHHIETSPFVMSKLPFVEAIYVMTDPRFTERHQNLRKAFLHQGISTESIEWRMKWNYTTCNSPSSHSHVYQRLNLIDKPLDDAQKRKCPLAMKHADVWYDMAEQNVGLGLILEDDAIFVPFFKEKFTRMIYAAMKDGILRINGTCIKRKEKSISNDERINQNPMIVIGTCFNFHGQGFETHSMNAPPLLTTHKSNPSRCTHAYLLTSCSAQGLVDQIHAQKNRFEPSDFMQNHLFPISRTLQAFWMDPPLSYQGNQVIDLDKLPLFKIQTYISFN